MLWVTEEMIWMQCPTNVKARHCSVILDGIAPSIATHPSPERSSVFDGTLFDVAYCEHE